MIINKNHNHVIYLYLSSVWESNDDNKIILMNITIEYINKLDKSDEAYFTYQLVKIDFLRRLGYFSEALEIIKLIENYLDSFDDDEREIIEIIIKYQIELINKRDQNEHKIPSIDYDWDYEDEEYYW